MWHQKLKNSKIYLFCQNWTVSAEVLMRKVSIGEFLLAKYAKNQNGKVYFGSEDLRISFKVENGLIILILY